MVQFLKKFGIEPDEDHSHFGQVKVMMELFYKQLYFHKEKFTQEGQNEAMYVVCVRIAIVIYYTCVINE